MIFHRLIYRDLRAIKGDIPSPAEQIKASAGSCTGWLDYCAGNPDTLAHCFAKISPELLSMLKRHVGSAACQTTFHFQKANEWCGEVSSTARFSAQFPSDQVNLLQIRLTVHISPLFAIEQLLPCKIDKICPRPAEFRFDFPSPTGS
jgi:hypothetical protein